MAKLESELAALRKRAELLDRRRTAAQTDLDQAKAGRERFLLEGDLDDSKTDSKLRAAVDSATSALAGYDSSIKTQTTLIAETEAKLAAEQDRADRRVTAEALHGQIVAIEETLPAWLQITRNLAAGFEGTAHCRPECAQMASYLRNAASEIQGAAAITFDDLHRWVTSVRDGNGPVLRAPAAPAPQVKAVPQAPTTRTVFAIHHLVWTDAQGGVRRHPKGNMCDLPIALADKAVAAAHAYELSDPRVKQLRGVYGAVMPPLEHCVSLDGTPTMPTTKPAIDPILSSHFEPHPDYVNAKPRTVTVPVRPVEPATASSRMLPDET